MKKFFLSFIVLLAVLSLAACKKSEFAADGDYTAFKYDTSHNAPQLTTVTVTIKDGKIEKFFIDTVQAKATVYDETVTPKVATKYAFNAQSKKQLSYLYGMHNGNDEANSYVKQDLTTEAGLNAYKAYLAQTGKKEWFQQAELVEKALLEKGVNGVAVADGEFVNLSGVTVSNGNYVELAKEAVELAKVGKVQAVLAVDANVIWATANVDKKGNLSCYTLDTIQGKVKTGVFHWNVQSKQQLQYQYGMHNADDAANEYVKQDLTTLDGVEAYKAYLVKAGKLDWFQQAQVLLNYIEEKDSVTALTLNEEGNLTLPAMSSVTVGADDYVAVFTQLFAKVK
jgi:major membrane immunogen (membrane-anchored lipoprotein)